MACKQSTYYCVVCTNNKENRLPEGLPPTLFKFPKSPPRKNKWIETLQISAQSIKWRSRVCEKHFKPNQFVNNRLKKDAVPTTSVIVKRKDSNSVTFAEKFRKIAPKPIQANLHAMNGVMFEKSPISASTINGYGDNTDTVSLLPSEQTQCTIPSVISLPLLTIPIRHVEPMLPQSPLIISSVLLPSLSQAIFPVNVRAIQDSSPAELLPTNQDAAPATVDIHKCEAERKREHKAKPMEIIDKKSLGAYRRKFSHRNCKKRISVLEKRIKKLKEENARKVDLDKVFVNNQGLLQIIKIQIYRFTKKMKPYSSFEKALALALYYSCGQNGYRCLLSMGLFLPKVNTLQVWTREFRFLTGINEQIFDCIQKVVEKLPNKDCVLMWDEMSIKEWLEYNKHEDIFEGIVDFGDEVRRLETANEVLVFMIHGIKSSWKFPLSYYFSANATTSEMLEKLVKRNINKLSAIGLNVRLCVCDMSFTNQGLYRSLEISFETPYYIFDGNIVFFVHDAPHLIKLVRNNLLKHDFEILENFGDYNGTVKWQHILSFYNKDKRTVSRMAPKLSSAHMELRDFSKMKVKLAVQVISHSVFAGITAMCNSKLLPQDALKTAFFIKMFDEIFDFLNISKYSDDKFGRCAEWFFQSMSKLDEYFKFLNSIQISGSSRTPEFLNGLKVTLSGIKMLALELRKEGYTEIYTRRLQQDSLENFFSAVRMRGGNCKNPTARQFRVNFRCLFFCHMMINPTNGNCESIRRRFYESLKNVENILPCRAVKAVSSKNLRNKKENLVGSCSASKFYTVKTNRRLKFGNEQEDIVSLYVGAASIKAVVSLNDCNVCKSMLTSEKQEDSSTILIDLKHFDPLSKLSYISEDTAVFFKYVNKEFYRVACKTLNETGKRILEGIFNVFEKNYLVSNWLVSGCSSESHRITIFRYFLRAKLFRLVKDKNEAIKKLKSWSQSRREMRNQ